MRSIEARGFAVGLPTRAEYPSGSGATVDVVVTNADGTEPRIPVPRDQAA